MKGKDPGAQTGANLVDENHAQRSALALLSAILGAPAAQVAEVLAVCTPADVALLDPPVSIALEGAAKLAAAGTDPGHEILHADLLRSGKLSGNTGRLAAFRMIDAASPSHSPVLLPELAAACLSAVLRVRLDAAGRALTAGAWVDPESDLWALLLREGQRARDLRDRLARLRGEPVDAV